MERYRSTHCIASKLHHMLKIRWPLMTGGQAQEYPMYSIHASTDVFNKATSHNLMERHRRTQSIDSILHQKFSIRRHLMTDGETQDYRVYSLDAAPDILNKAASHDRW
jgi:hypothetical protein